MSEVGPTRMNAPPSLATGVRLNTVAKLGSRQPH
jgi:hypothetical protein